MRARENSSPASFESDPRSAIHGCSGFFFAFRGDDLYLHLLMIANTIQRLDEPEGVLRGVVLGCHDPCS